ncbi:universal stress protein [Herbaspirillum sp. RTI4]|uniref:universal stress protein n=1 Tax=Herbaspirillum sp. RTI4 TaxID=3048640 RepID=UPI002AB48FE6|nr:universal stress protein [Herbaspirillum sp. RTI4]MDY7578941.1 universal stress protein [Herbaspirillum sp. RTI4]MEA9982030.1 universal stress protein [Herbaspirillum sp. RTI4]
MTYKTLLVHVDQSSHAAARIKIAAKIAIAEDAHLIGSAMTGVSRYLYQDGVVFIESVITSLRAQANLALDQFDAIARQMGVNSFERRLVDDDAGGGLSLQARYSDLVILSQTDPDERTDDLITDLPEYVMLNSARPVLALPYAGNFDRLGSNVLIAWDGSMEATRAVTNALPILKKAKNVTVALFNTSKQFDVHGEQPGADIGLYLARHGVKIDVEQRKTDLDIGNALLSLAADKGSDLLVMGGYGHTRFREILLGGVTLSILRTMTIPVLMSH